MPKFEFFIKIFKKEKEGGDMEILESKQKKTILNNVGLLMTAFRLLKENETRIENGVEESEKYFIVERIKYILPLWGKQQALTEEDQRWINNNPLIFLLALEVYRFYRTNNRRQVKKLKRVFQQVSPINIKKVEF